MSQAALLLQLAAEGAVTLELRQTLSGTAQRLAAREAEVEPYPGLDPAVPPPLSVF